MEKIYNPDLHTKMQYLENAKNYTKGISQLSYELLQVEQGQNVLEFGCGGGYDVFEMANLVGTTGSVYGVDIDAETVQYAQSKNSFPNVFFEQNTTPTLRFKDNSFDRIRTERVLQHVPNAEETIEDLVRVLKPNGKISIIETDWASLTFFSSYLDLEQQLSNYITKYVTANGLITRYLPNILAKKHLINLSVQICPYTIYNQKNAESFLTLKSIIERGVVSQLIDPVLLQKWNSEMLQREHSKLYAMQVNFMIFTVTKK